MNKKILAMLLVCVMVVGLLAGCGSKQENAPAADNAPQAETTAPDASTEADSEVTSDGILTISLSSAAAKLDPIHYTGVYEGQIIDEICDRLVEYNDELNTIVGSLATEWTISDDGVTYVFKIREGVKFQNGKYVQGRELTADDVAYSLNRSAQFSDNGRLAMLDKAEVTGNLEVTCTLKAANAAFLTALTDAGNSILAPEEVEGWGDDLGVNLCGTGPFIMEKFENDEQAVLVANEDYWMGAPNLKGVTFKFIKDASQAANALIKGEVQLATGLTGESINTVANAGGPVTLMKSKALKISYIRLNMQNGPTSDLLVRQALVEALDLDAIRSALYKYNEAEAACLPLPYDSWGYDAQWESLALSYDLEDAKAKLQEAGYTVTEQGGVVTTTDADGKQLELNMYVSDTQERKDLETLCQAYWAMIGIKLNTYFNDWGTFSDTAASGNADVYAMSWAWYPDPYFFLDNLFHSRNSASNGNGALYIREEVDAALEAATATTDQAARAAEYSKVLKMAMEDVTGIYYANPYNCDGIRDNVKDYVARADGNIRLMVWDGQQVVRNTSVG